MPKLYHLEENDIKKEGLQSSIHVNFTHTHTHTHTHTKYSPLTF